MEAKNVETISIDKKSPYLRQVIALGDQSHATVGFLPEQAFNDYAEKKRILGLVNIEDTSLIAYIMYRYKNTTCIIVQLCVGQQYRGKGYAKQLMDALVAKEKEFASDFQLSCRRDYGLESFWTSLGFQPIGERDGRATREKTILTIWNRHNTEMQNLFSALYKNEDSLAKVVLDTNVVIDLYCSEPRSIALQQDFLREYVDYHISPDVLSEVNKQSDKTVRNDQREYAKSHFTILYGIDENRVAEISDRINKIKPCPKGSNTWFDIRHIAVAIATDSEAFITNDLEWTDTSLRDAIFDEYGLRIFTPNELVKRIDELDSPEAYAPRLLAGLNLQYSEVRQERIPAVIDAFYTQYADKRKKSFAGFIRAWVAEIKTHHILLVTSNGQPLCAIPYCEKDGKLIVESIYYNNALLKQAIQGTFITRIMFKLLEKARKNALSEIQVKMGSLQKELVPSIKKCGFIENGDYLVRFVRIGIYPLSNVEKVRSLSDNSTLNVGIEKLRQQNEDRWTIRDNELINLEKIFWPMKLLTLDTIRCFIVPIRAEYAKDLFDEKLADVNPSFFENEKYEPALSIENVYYKSNKQRIPYYPARILWYVSQSQMMGTGAIRACSYLDLVKVGNAKRLYHSYRRLGVLDYNQLVHISSGSLAAYKFSYTELFDKPVALDRIRKILRKPRFSVQSYKEIRNEQFLKIYSEGMCDVGNFE